MKMYDFKKDITKDKHIFTGETIQQYYLISFVLEENNITDQHELNKTIKLINRYEIETIDKNNNDKVRYIFNEDDNTIQVKNALEEGREMKDNYLDDDFIKIPLEDKNLYDNDFNNIIKELDKMLKSEYQATIEVKGCVGMSGNNFNKYYLVLKKKK